LNVHGSRRERLLLVTSHYSRDHIIQHVPLLVSDLEKRLVHWSEIQGWRGGGTFKIKSNGTQRRGRALAPPRLENSLSATRRRLYLHIQMKEFGPRGCTRGVRGRGRGGADACVRWRRPAVNEGGTWYTNRVHNNNQRSIHITMQYFFFHIYIFIYKYGGCGFV
jgi:hypothetical protein